MAAVIRVKRHLSEEPLNALILNCKKRKTDAESSNEDAELSTVLKFAGTLNNQQEDITPHLNKPTKNKIEEQFKKHNIDLNAKLRVQKQQDSKNSRYKIVNCFRSQTASSETSGENSANPEYTVYDIETDSHEDHEDNVESQTRYVYDLYYTSSDYLGDAYLEDYVSVYPCSDELFFDSMRNKGLNESDSDDSEDSNAENNWKNDYPDESDLESITDEDMIKAMKRVDLNDLSSDDEEEGLVYNEDHERSANGEDIDEGDVARFGERYAKFKAKHSKKDVVTSSLDQDLYYGDIDEEEYYY